MQDQYGPWAQPNAGTSTQPDFQGSLLKFLMGQQQTGPQAFATALPGVLYASNINKYNQPANQIASAMGNLNSPMYQQLYGQFRQQGQQNLADQIMMMEGRNRSLAAMGRVPLFSPERNGEDVFRQMTKGYQDIQNNASQQAFGQMQNMYNAAAAQGQMRQQAALTKANVGSNLLGAITKMLGF